jgi:Homeodomain-like domain-containing protein
MNVTPHDLTDLGELRRRIRQEANAKQRDRYRAVLLAMDDKTTSEIMAMLGRSMNFVQRRVYFYRDHGLERVRPLKQPGQPQRLPPRRHPAFLERIPAVPGQPGRCKTNMNGSISTGPSTRRRGSRVLWSCRRPTRR